MQLLGCLAMLFVAFCIMAFAVVLGFWLVVGTIMLISKLIVWMAYLGAFFIIIALLAGLLSKAWYSITR